MIFVAVVALIEVLLFGCCTAGVFVTEPSITELRDSPFGVPEGVTEEQMLTMVRGIQIALAIASALVFVLPGLALLIMTPWIDRGRRGAINAARIILWVQAVLIGLALLTNVIISLLTLNLLSLLVSLVFLGSLLALQVLAIRALSQSRPSSAAPFDDDHDLEPWNSHLT